MATITKNCAETSKIPYPQGGQASALATHTITVSMNGSNDVIIRSSDDDIFKPITVGFKYNNSADSRNSLHDFATVDYKAIDDYVFYDYAEKEAYASANTLVTAVINPSYQPGPWHVFNGDTKTIRRSPVYIQLNSYSVASGWWQNNHCTSIGYGEGGYSDWVKAYDLVLDAPPTFNTTQVSFDTSYVYAGLTTASVTVSALSAKFGGDIASVSFTIGNQTVTRANAGTLSIPLSAAGSFTPTVTVIDSRGQSTTKALDPIVVNAYSAPAVGFTAERTDSAGIDNDEGECAVVEANITWTEAAATLTAPSVVVKDPDGLSVTVTVSWYKDRALTTAISDWSAITSGDMPIYALIDNANHDALNTQYSYQITITPNDSEGSGTPITQTIGSAFYTVDFLAGGHGIAFGRPATKTDVFECDLDAEFNNDVRLGLNTAATSGTDKEIYDALVALGWDSDVII